MEQNKETNSVQISGGASAVGEVFGFARSSVHEHLGQMGCYRPRIFNTSEEKLLDTALEC